MLGTTKSKIIAGISLLVLVIGTAVGIYLVQQNQKLQEEAAPASSLTMAPGNQSKAPGENVNFTVNLDTGVNVVYGYKLVINYNPAVINVTSIDKGSFAAALDQEIVKTTNNTTGQISYTVFTIDKTKALTGSGEALRITAQVKSDAQPGDYSLDFASSTAVSGVDEGQNVLIGKSGAHVTVTGAASPTPAETPVASASPAASASPLASASPAASASPSVAPSASPSVAPSPTPGGGLTQASPSPSTAASASPKASSAPAASTAASPVASAKPTVTLPASGTVAAGTTISGTAAPNSTVTIVIKSKTITATVKADSTGKWSYKIPADIENGTHTITITDSKGTTTKSFKVTGGTTATSSAEALPATGTSWPTVVGASLGALLLVIGLVLAL